jgi:hypothetical protein
MIKYNNKPSIKMTIDNIDAKTINNNPQKKLAFYNEQSRVANPVLKESAGTVTVQGEAFRVNYKIITPFAQKDFHPYENRFFQINDEEKVELLDFLQKPNIVCGLMTNVSHFNNGEFILSFLMQTGRTHGAILGAMLGGEMNENLANKVMLGKLVMPEFKGLEIGFRLEIDESGARYKAFTQSDLPEKETALNQLATTLHAMAIASHAVLQPVAREMAKNSNIGNGFSFEFIDKNRENVEVKV